MLERDDLTLLQGMHGMATQERSTQSTKQSEYRHTLSKHIVIIIVVIATCLLIAIVWFLSTLGIIAGSWTTISVIIFPILGVLVSFFQWLSVLSPEKSEHEVITLSSTKEAVSPININITKQPVELPPTSAKKVPQSSISVFCYNTPLTDPLDFFGREAERRKLLERTRKGGSTLIFGPRKIGKTWLLRYLDLVAPKELGPHYRIVYISAASPVSHTIGGFTASVLNELDDSTSANHFGLKLENLALAVRDLKKRKDITTILCIDNFEAWSGQQEFDTSFFSGLRGLTQDGLVLVIASRRLLDDVLGDTLGERGITSPFSNIFTSIKLGPFTSSEAEQFISEKANQAGLTEEEKRYLLEFSEYEMNDLWPPMKLQLAGEMLLEDKLRSGADESYSYHPDDPDYWHDFEKRLQEAYMRVAGPY
jgi:hypothetical protein